MSSPLASSSPMFLFSCFLIKEVIVVVGGGDGGCGRSIHLSIGK
jgi:hypothetical protein